MKKIVLLIAAIFVCSSFSFSQSPEAFNYQSIIKNADGEVLANQEVSFLISVLSGSSTGSSVYIEVHNISTNDFGMANLMIGNGDVQNGVFSEIDWGSNEFFLKIELDIEGGTAYEEIGVMQLISVPYALYAKDVANKDDDDADPSNEIQSLSISSNELTISDGNTVLLPVGNGIWTMNGDDAVYLSGNVGIGKNNPVSKLEVKGDATTGPDDPLFQVINKDGDTVFAVYPDGAKVYINENAKGNIGGFAVSGRNTSKSGINDYLTVTPDSVRIYLRDDQTKGNIGGFAVSGKSTTKNSINYFNVSVNDSAQIINPSKPGLLWYPSREAFLSGRVLVEHPDSVGFNSMATGYESKAIGNTSQAFGYQCVAKHSNATAMGYKARALGANSFALGDGPTARGTSSFAFGEYTIAEGNACLAIGARERDSLGNIGRNTRARGLASMAIGVGAIVDGISNAAIGIHATATGDFGSGAIGPFCTSTAWGAIAIGFADSVTGKRAMALGAENYVGGPNAMALGSLNRSNGFHSTAIGAGNIVLGDFSTVIGAQNQSGGNHSIVMGNMASDGGFNNCFVYADSATYDFGVPFSPSDNNQFAVLAKGGTQIFYGYDLGVGAGVILDPYGPGGWDVIGGMGFLEDAEIVKEDDLLRRYENVKVLKITKQNENVKADYVLPDPNSIYEDLGIGKNNNRLSSLSIAGSNMAAIKALEKRTRMLQEENDQLREELREIKEMLKSLNK